MRILQYSFFSLLFLLITTVVLFVIAQEILVFWGTASVTSALSQMKKSTVQDVCQSYLKQYAAGGLKVGYHLRFNSSTEFVTEAYCHPFNSNIQTLKQATLPPFVSKIPGSSGIIYGTERSSLGITAFDGVYTYIRNNARVNMSFLQKKKYILVENEVIKTEGKFTSYGQTPRTSCEGYGYTCCNSVTEAGVGEQIVNTTNCERSCFTSCVRRPSILSFNSDPFPDIETRAVTVTAGEPVIFNYLSDLKSTDEGSAHIDFGDGTSASGVSTTGSAQHVYDCGQRTCQYTASLTITDGNGGSSAATVLSVLHIVVTR